MCNHNCNQGRDCPGECGTEIDEMPFDIVDVLIFGGTAVALITLIVLSWI